MTPVKRFLVGGVGGLAPTLLNLVVVDVDARARGFTILVLVGYLLRTCGLFLLGGIWAYLHQRETSPAKVFQLEMLAPAVLTSLINAGNASKTLQASLTFARPAYAADATSTQTYKFSVPEETPVQQLVRGITGGAREKTWSVIAGSYPTLKDAQQQAASINARVTGLTARVYEPAATQPHYSVVLGANLTFEEAQRLRDRAIRAGLSPDTHVWQFTK